MSQDKCQCSFSIRVLGDGCRYCQPQEYIDRLHDSMEDMIHAEPLSDLDITSIWQSDECYQNAQVFARVIEKHIKGE